MDGVLTDGSIYYGESGEELKKFNIHDGHGIVKLQQAGVTVGIITGRSSKLVQRRADDLGIHEVYQSFENKMEAYERLKAKLGLSDDEIAYVGDDEPDVAVLKRVGFSAAPSDAVEHVKRQVDYVSIRRGGEGAVRDVIELILRGRENGRR